LAPHPDATLADLFEEVVGGFAALAIARRDLPERRAGESVVETVTGGTRVARQDFARTSIRAGAHRGKSSRRALFVARRVDRSQWTERPELAPQVAMVIERKGRQLGRNGRR